MTARCLQCDHASSHDLFKKCRTAGCSCRDYIPSTDAAPLEPTPDEHTIVVRDPVTEAPIAVPDAYIAAAERPFRAYLAHAGGANWEKIAFDEAYPSPEAAAEAVKMYLREGYAIVGNFRRVEALAMEVGRLNMQTEFLWGKAKGGSIPANMAVLSLARLRSQLLGLLEREVGDSVDGEPLHTTVVIGQTSYTSDLRAIAGADAEAEYDVIFFDDSDPDSEPYLGEGATF